MELVLTWLEFNGFAVAFFSFIFSIMFYENWQKRKNPNIADSFQDLDLDGGYEHLGVNPASGLPMIDEFFDCRGNPYGCTPHEDE